MKVLVACEFPGMVRAAFRRRGHEAYSCDLLPAADGSPYHLQRNVLDLLGERWDLLIAHPPCTYLCNSGVRWLYRQGTRERVSERWDALHKAAGLVDDLWRGHRIPCVAIENPIMHGHARELINFGPPDQIVQPWQFGHPETKATCLWLRGLPPLQPTKVVAGRRPRVHHESPGPDRWKRRSITYQGLADAMAMQWGSLPVLEAR